MRCADAARKGAGCPCPAAVRRPEYWARIASFLVFGLVLISALLWRTPPALAACIQTGTTVDCTGDLNNISFGAPGVRDLNVYNLTSGAGSINLSGAAAITGRGTTSHYVCSVPGECAITPGDGVVADTCAANPGAACVFYPAATGGPSSKAGANLRVYVDAGAHEAGRVTVLSQGLKGSQGSDECCRSGGGGGDGANGGLAIGILYANPGLWSGGLTAASQGGNGGRGGNSDIAGRGGDGGKGGFGGDATALFLQGSILTLGDGVVGVGAFSQGGAGGDGGNGGFTGGSSGGGDNAGAAGVAQVHTAVGTKIITIGDGAYGVQARSLGGGGGDGGGGFGLFYSESGNGARGGDGGKALVLSHAGIITYGEGAHGILAQSIGGSGGDSKTAVGPIALGATGGIGGNGGLVDIVNTGAITTYGLNANAIEAQSIGGGGGNGSTSVGLVALGGEGGGASQASSVHVFNSGVLHTHGARSVGIMAQSIGGGGGNGGTSAGVFSAGGKGGSGAHAGSVIIVNSGNIETGINGLSAAGAPGILAQSIGGGGGNGGGAISAGSGYAASFGGSGGLGGNGSSVDIWRDDSDPALATAYTIHTHGHQSAGIVAQSIGGGGGNGGFAVSASAASPLGVALGVAGAGGPGGHSSGVFVATKGAILTDGNQSAGIIAQSIGGGGGNGGFSISTSLAGGAAVAVGGGGGSGGNSGRVWVDNLADITTQGLNSIGILAQSIGGGGGNGGFSTSVAIGGLGAQVGLGGSGGAGGHADAVTVISAGDISTAGANAIGILAQSIGGGGGNGGFAVSGGAALAGVNVALGGSGGSGGYAASVVVSSVGNIHTRGDNAGGIVAQSIGGGGGNGGFALSAALNAGAGINLSLGGAGGAGQNAGSTNVTADAGAGGETFLSTGSTVWNLITHGANAPGILAQSIGGGGGNGGFAGSALLSAGINVGVAVGGRGNGGGDAGAVTVTSGLAASGLNILTLGERSAGIQAQSIGGGGGNGGFAFSVSGGGLILPVGSAAVAVGGSGGPGGDAGVVSVTSAGYITTLGYMSNAISAQSIGGGGGDGGYAASGSFDLGGATFGLAIGGAGRSGGRAENVTVSSYAQASGGLGVADVPVAGQASILTYGDRANGILAQSIGGGGGNGGFAVSGAFALAGASASVGVGGAGSGGGLAGSVSVTSYHNITTHGMGANAIFAQSIGGSGGDGGFAASLSGGAGFGLSASVGGLALGGGGDASAVTVLSHGHIRTAGDTAHGILAQSIGSGGGNGGIAVSGAFSTGAAALSASIGGFGSVGGNGGDVIVSAYSGVAPVQPAPGVASLVTQGDGAEGILAQSIGGGGGNGGLSVSGGATLGGGAVSLSVGGFGAAGGAAGAVVVISAHNILTEGNDSTGILAQSIGGGGGNGGLSVSAAGGLNFGASVALGGFGGGGGDAEAVSITSLGSVATGGDRSSALMAQSIGGGGGNGGFSLSGVLSLNNAGISASLGGTGGTGGVGRDVTISSNALSVPTAGVATLETAGESASAILAQSIGGGGGRGGFSGSFTATVNSNASMSFSAGGFGGNGGSAGQVGVLSHDNILTAGAGSNGILAQSIGGGGGDGGFSFAGTVAASSSTVFSATAALGGFGGGGGNAGGVTVTHVGHIETHGVHAAGILAQSIGGGGGFGGYSVAGSFTFTQNVVGPAITASVGGFGGAGGTGGAVSLDQRGNIRTLQDYAPGLVAQSIGGGGGAGGLSVSGGIGGPGTKRISASVGGFGGPGSGAADVMVRNEGNITTGQEIPITVQIAALGHITVDLIGRTGRNAYGILAQSIGGGGGAGGFSFSGAVGLTGQEQTMNVGATVGGFGGSGGVAGKVDVTSLGRITTYGPDAHAIVAQSIGGGGGTGGAAITGLLSAGDNQAGGRSVALAASIGGMGGDGNRAGDVNVSQTGLIATYGSGSLGILAQSIGGGGGAGGGANSLSFQLAGTCSWDALEVVPLISGCQNPKKNGVSAQVDVGGFGGTGNDAGSTTVINDGSILTTGTGSTGIQAQSIGGGGGVGGRAIVGFDGLFPYAYVLDGAAGVGMFIFSTTGTVEGAGKVTIGGFGGASGNGGDVSVTNNGLIATYGADADAIQAQSIGGGGGSGGGAASGLVGAFSLGGFGGAAGYGGTVDVVNASGATLRTFGANARGILAQSIGGGGGSGGIGGGSVALGGSGGVAGDGGHVSVSNSGVILTDGVSSVGVLAQSIGGGGGDGGGGGLSILQIGGTGGSNGDGGLVEVTNSARATIGTLGIGAHGILAQSIGGGGGAGGSNGLLAAITVGGNGGNAGEGGAVTITNLGTVQTAGSDAYGILAQSIGGSGGAAGGALVTGVSVGGRGGPSGSGGLVTVTNAGGVATSGAGADAIHAQSIGGGGGASYGGTEAASTGPALIAAVGGVGAGGGDGGKVMVTNSGLILTTGETAHGISAQSIGGGGGSGGRALGTVAVGGQGGHSGNGGAVEVLNDVGGVIQTTGTLSAGVFAQSVGGGGGSGGGSYAAPLLAGTPLSGVNVSVGGSASGGGNGGAVRVTNAGTITVAGDSAQAIFAQSVGGGGGSGAVAAGLSVLSGAGSISGVLTSFSARVGGDAGSGGNGGSVTVVNAGTGRIYVLGNNSVGIFAQSVGGGGGHGGGVMPLGTLAISSTLSLGGTGGAGGHGGDVSVTNDGVIALSGNNSVGIMAQSVGGGGGSASHANRLASIPLQIGGGTGAVGNGGLVRVVNNGTIVISGDNSFGILAQSVGGGGGIVLPGQGALDIVQMFGGTGDGGKLTVEGLANIIMTGKKSAAMFVQSVGGGGGTVGGTGNETFRFAGSTGGRGAGGTLLVNQTGNLIATGDGSYGLVAQSAGTDGAGDMTLNIHNPATGGPSIILGGTGEGAGVLMMGGGDNRLTNDGAISSVPGINGYAIRSTTGNDTIDNNGLMIGSLALGGGINSVANRAGAQFDFGATIDLGGGTFVNRGLIGAGGYGVVMTTTLGGSLVAEPGATLGVDLDLTATQADKILVSGPATLAGTVRLNVLNAATGAATQRAGETTYTLLLAAGGTTHSGLQLDAMSTAVARYALTYPNPRDVVLTQTVDFAPQGLIGNQIAVGAAVNAIQAAQGTPAFGPVATALFFQSDRARLGAVYDGLSGEGTLAHQQTSVLAIDRFTTNMVNRMASWLDGDRIDPFAPQGLPETASSFAPARQPHPALGLIASLETRRPSWRMWSAGFGAYGTARGVPVSNLAATSQRDAGYAAGLDYRFGEHGLVGIAAGWSHAGFTVRDRATTGRIEAGHGAVYGALRDERAYVFGSLGVGVFNNTTRRFATIPGSIVGAIVVPGYNERLVGKFGSTALTGYLEAGYRMSSGGLALTPFVAVQPSWLHSSAYQETNDGAPSSIGLSFPQRDVRSLPLFAGAQISATLQLSEKVTLSTSLRAAWKREFETARGQSPSFNAAPAVPFMVRGAPATRDMARVQAGLQVNVGNSLSLFSHFGGDFARSGRSFSGSAGLRYAW